MLIVYNLDKAIQEKQLIDLDPFCWCSFTPIQIPWLMFTHFDLSSTKVHFQTVISFSQERRITKLLVINHAK
jgi:hypothetical protein